VAVADRIPLTSLDGSQEMIELKYKRAARCQEPPDPK
jgi:hypothetical protein